MSTRMKAPEDVASAHVDGVDYEVGQDGHIVVENGEHVPTLTRHGFVLGESDAPVLRPDFDSMTREQICKWLNDEGIAMASNTSKTRLVEIASDTWTRTQEPELALEPVAETETETETEESVDDETETK